jgi:hypothetical protein
MTTADVPTVWGSMWTWQADPFGYLSLPQAGYMVDDGIFATAQPPKCHQVLRRIPKVVESRKKTTLRDVQQGNISSDRNRKP